MTQLVIMCAYLLLLVTVGLAAGRMLDRTARDYFLASSTIGPVVLFLSIFGTTMTAFALVGATGEAYHMGISVFPMVASWSALIHAAIFFFIGIPVWSLGKRLGFLTQTGFLRRRFESPLLGMVLFPILAGLLIPYLLTGLLGASGVVAALTRGAFPEAFPATMGGVPGWLTGLAISGVVMVYVFSGGLRATAWANAFQTMVFLTTAVAAFFVIANRLGGPEAISHRVLAFRPDLLVREGNVTHLQFFTYLFIPVSAAMFPHLFQHWLTARSARAFRTTVVLHPIAMAVLWLPCTLIGMWAAVALLPNGTAVVAPNSPPNTELAQMVEKLTAPLLGGLLGSGILAAIMSSLDSQFLALGTMFTEDVAHHYFGRDKLSDSQRVKLGRLFVVLMIALTYALSLWAPRSVFALGIWCFNGYAALAPLIIAAIYWKRATAAGAIGSVLVTGVAWLLLYRAAGYGQDANYLFLGMMPAAALFMVASAVLIGVSLITRPPSLGTLDLFFSADEPATVLTSGAYSAKL